MLYPIQNALRQRMDLSGFWSFQADPSDHGIQKNWMKGLPSGRPIAVPASWNDQFEDLRDFLGPAWYETRIELPWGWQGQQLLIRFCDVTYLADVWLNGIHLGQHEGGHLPFTWDMTEAVQASDNLLVVRVDGRLAHDRVPPGNITGSDLDFFASHAENHPQTQYDFFPYRGIQRPVLIFTRPAAPIEDITVTTDLVNDQAQLHFDIQPHDAHYRVSLNHQGLLYTMEKDGRGQINIKNPALWSPEAPHLHTFTVERLDGHCVSDAYTLSVGLRTIAVDDQQLLLNEKPIHLQGFGRHEDFPITGKGLLPPLIVKDYALMQWMGANSFRTSHYPYSEEMMGLADRLGFLVIDETPAVGLYFNSDGLEKRLALCQQYTREMIQRDKNHPSVIAWSLANEPHSGREAAKPFFRDLFDLARSLDSSRPITLVSCMGVIEESFAFLDFMCLNRYFGWYQESGQIERGAAFLSAELDLLYETYQKPIVLTEFGADTLPGHHAHPPEMFSEEFQADFLSAYIRVLRSKPYVVGEHVWNFSDFKTSQAITRIGGYNYKGVFTRDRRPKLAAHRLREIWKNESE